MAETTSATRRRATWDVMGRVWCALIALDVAAALVTQLVLVFQGGTDANSGDTLATVGLGVRIGRFLSYFTIESNIIVLVVVITLIRSPQRDGRGWRVARLDCLLGIIITGLVYDIVLASQEHLHGAAFVATVGLHYVAPWATLIGWLLFGPRPRITWPSIALAFVWPIVWIAYTFVHGAITGWYPYPFLDAGKKGYAHAVTATVAVVVIGLVIASLLKLGDRRLPTVGLRRAQSRPAPGSGRTSRQE